VSAVVLAEMSGRGMWYMTRATGIVALVLLTSTMVMGVAAGGNWARPRWPRFVTQGLHRNLSLLAVMFVFAHVTTTVVDGYVPAGWLSAFVPFTSPYKRVWLGLGAVAFDLILALILTSLVRHRLNQTTWRAIHWLAYASWPVALVHGLGAGTDVTPVIMRWVTALSIVATGAALAWRLTRRWPFRTVVRVLSVLALSLLTADAALSGAFGLLSHSALRAGGAG
jgi:DMSO/TMAO reductase YedYZ heme-binding membrane subunit